MLAAASVVILAAKRTPIGAFQGGLASARATQLGGLAIAAACAQAGIALDAVAEVLMGCCLMAGLGQAPARQAALNAGLPPSVPATTLTKMCGSGMKAVMLAHDALLAGNGEFYLAGGMESMSNAPYLLPSARGGQRIGAAPLLDHMFYDGLRDAYGGALMGHYAERCAQQLSLTRGRQDAYALESVRRAQEAVALGWFDAEIATVNLTSGKQSCQLDRDETPGRCHPQKITQLQPAFDPQGSITAASSASISDGAAALVLARADAALRQGLRPLARIVAHSTHAQAPEEFPLAPIGAIQQLLARTGWRIEDVALFEINEAFAVVALAAQQALNIAPERLNIKGGACALGHPIGATGARIIVTLLHTMQERGAKRGIAALCIGGGEATAIALELP